ncbi:MAG TPA: NUDIX domain-containing protein [Gaiellaceae bacterium]|nr:NUDIX domain-containing protein [Gaiellaceae bacterium]
MYTVDDSQAKTAAHAVLAAVLQVRDGRLQALLWQRGRDPFAGCWALPGGALAPDETLEESMRRHLADKVDVRELSHLEQLETRSDPQRNPVRRELATGYLGLVPSGLDPSVPDDTCWHPLDELPELAYDHEEILLSARERLRGKLSYTNLGFALAPPSFTLAQLRDLYAAALGHPVSATNLQRVLLRRRLLEDTGELRQSGRGGGRPATIYRFRSRELAITDQFAVLRPPTMAP